MARSYDNSEDRKRAILRAVERLDVVLKSEVARLVMEQNLRANVLYCYTLIINNVVLLYINNARVIITRALLPKTLLSLRVITSWWRDR